MRNSILKYFFCFITLLICIFTLSKGALSQIENSKLKLTEKKFSVSISQKSFYEILGNISTKNKIPIGVQVTGNNEPASCRKEMDFNFQDVGIVDILNALVAQCPIYSWSIEDEIINVYPIIKEKSVLDVKLSAIEVKDKETDDIIDSIFECVEVKSELQSQNLQRDDTAGFPRNSKSIVKKYSFKVTNKDLRYVLNYLIRNTDNKFWVIYKVSTAKSFISLNIL